MEILAGTAQQLPDLQNVCTPLSFNVHFGFCIVATLLYLIQFYRKRSIHYILMMIAVDLTFITQYWTGKAVMAALFVAEVILLVLSAVFSHKYNKQQKLKQENKDKSNAGGKL